MPTEPESDTISAEAIAVQVIQDHQELAKKYASGDASVLGALQAEAAKLAAGRVGESALKDTLVRKLGASI